MFFSVNLVLFIIATFTDVHTLDIAFVCSKTHHDLQDKERATMKTENCEVVTSHLLMMN